MQVDDLADVLGGRGKKGGKRWQLIFTAGDPSSGCDVADATIFAC
jgi:hypothetical protein